MIGVIIASFFIARLRTAGPARPGVEPPRPAPVLHILDALALITPPGLFLGRMANFVNGELLGRFYALPGKAAPWWTVRFPQEVEVGALDLPADVAATRDAAIQHLMTANNIPGNGFGQQYHNLVQMIQHGRHDLAAQLEPYLAARFPSQIFQGVTEGVVLFVVLWAIARRPRLPGVVGCWFLITYGVLRITTEFWRLPDAQLAVKRILGLSRGQWLSVGMIVAGLVALAIIIRRGGQKLGGWGVRSPAAA
jgi:phosphatidylglycerol:prolipoprotein diacylglycerol transferase